MRRPLDEWFALMGGLRGRGGPDWWCALPDTEATTPAVSLLCGVGDVLSRHACGRPWIIGQHRFHALQLVDFGPRRVAILGECLGDINRLAAGAHGGVDQLMATLLSLSGSFHIVIADPAGLVATGDVAGFRRLFTACADGVAVVSSHADVLRRLLDAPVTRSLAILLLCRSRGQRVAWRVGVHTPPPSSHSWVEAAGQPVAEPFDPYALYTPVITV